MRLLLDEHFSPRIARELRARGHDVVAVAERPDLVGRSDARLLEVIAGEGRAILSEDVADFATLARARLRDGAHHAGLVFTSARRFPRDEDGIGSIVRSVALLMEAHPAALALESQELWLRAS